MPKIALGKDQKLLVDLPLSEQKWPGLFANAGVESYLIISRA